MRTTLAASLALFFAVSCGSVAVCAEIATESLGPLPPDIIQSASSDYAKHILISSREKEGESLWLDGNNIAKETRFQGIALSPDGSHYMYASKSGTRVRVVRDGKEIGTFDDVDGIFTREDGSRVPKFYFSPDGDRFGFIAENGGKEIAVIDGNVGPSYYNVGYLVFSSDGKHVAYAAFKDPDPATGADSSMAIVDGKEIDDSLPTFKVISNIAFVPNSSTLIYSAKSSVVLGGEVVVKDLTLRTKIVFSEGGKHFAFSGFRVPTTPGAISGFETVVVVDGKAKVLQGVVPEDYPVVYSVSISPNGKRIAYGRWDAIGRVEEQMVQGRITTARYSLATVVIDDKTGPQLEGLESDVVFSPDSKQVGYLGKKADGCHLFLDDKEGPACDDISGLTFSKDSQHHAYCAKRGDRWIAVLDGKDLADFSVLPNFIPRHVLAELGPSSIQFDTEGYLCFLARKDGQILRIRAKPEQAETPAPKSQPSNPPPPNK